MNRTRQSFIEGHCPKFLLLIDGSSEADRAIAFAARRALRINAGIILLAVVNSEDFAGTHLFGSAQVMRQESYEAAERRLQRAQMRLKRMGLMPAQELVKEGATSDVIHQTIAEELDIFALVLASGISNEGPGPLISSLSRSVGQFKVPIVIVPGHLSEEEIEALA
jgi:nucleotide-binding universal stress UspA family protein